MFNETGSGLFFLGFLFFFADRFLAHVDHPPSMRSARIGAMGRSPLLMEIQNTASARIRQVGQRTFVAAVL